MPPVPVVMMMVMVVVVVMMVMVMVMVVILGHYQRLLIGGGVVCGTFILRSKYSFGVGNGVQQIGERPRRLERVRFVWSRGDRGLSPADKHKRRSGT